MAKSLHELLEHRVQTKKDALEIWAALPAVMGDCDRAETFGKTEAASAYSWLHLLDRYVRTWLALERLVEHNLLPMGKEGVRVLDVGTGPGPSAFATHDFYTAMIKYAEKSRKRLWHQPPQMTCVEFRVPMNQFRHHLAEFMAMNDAPRSVLAMCDDVGVFNSIFPTEERKAMNHSLRWAEDSYYDGHRKQWDWEPRYTPEEANHIANRHHRYRLFTFSNILTKTSKIEEFRPNLIDILNDAHAGSVLLLIGGRFGKYQDVRIEVADLAHEAGFLRTLENLQVSSSDAEMDGVVYAEQVRFYRKLERLGGDLPVDNPAARKCKGYFERGESGSWGTSSIHAYRK
ncbi:MAG: hypothetical protein OXI20_05255 [Rhodospirillales bacterium]|nr:hypothetical protein [Rhodospirillales bacterium]